MPEGPSIVILKELVQDLHLVGKKVTHAEGDARIDMDQLLHQKLIAIKSWGKHFLICFKDCTIRIHLLMFGSYRINERKESQVRLRLNFNGAELNFYTCSVKILQGNVNDHYDWTADIMADDWNAEAAIDKLKKEKDTSVCDALLDQNIFSGLGNIIKNEVLYRAAIHPENTIGLLPPARLRIMVKAAREYSFDFLKWKKENKLAAHWEVYQQKLCPKGHELEKKYMGEGKRRTFFCNACQKMYSKKGKS